MELIASFLFYFLGIRALFRLPRYKEGKHRLRRWLLDGACKGFFYTMAVVAFVYLVMWMQGGVVLTPQELVVGGGSGIILGFVTSIYGLLKYWNKKDKGSEPKKTKKSREEDWEETESTGEERTMTEKIRATRNQIQREIQRKKMEGQRMMNDSYLKPEVKKEISERYSNCIRLLQELYAEASNVLAYLETNGSDFRIDFDTLYVSEQKQGELQAQVDRLKAFHQLNTGEVDYGIDELMKKYDEDLQKIRFEDAESRRGMAGRAG